MALFYGKPDGEKLVAYDRLDWQRTRAGDGMIAWDYCFWDNADAPVRLLVKNQYCRYMAGGFANGEFLDPPGWVYSEMFDQAVRELRELLARWRQPMDP